MNTFSSTLDLQNLKGFDTGIPTNSLNITHFLLKLLLFALTIGGVFYYIYSLNQKKKQEAAVSEKIKLQ